MVYSDIFIVILFNSREKNSDCSVSVMNYEIQSTNCLNKNHFNKNKKFPLVNEQRMCLLVKYIQKKKKSAMRTLNHNLL